MSFFRKKIIPKPYDKENKKPVIKASICNGEQVAGFKDIQYGKVGRSYVDQNSRRILQNLKKCMG